MENPKHTIHFYGLCAFFVFIKFHLLKEGGQRVSRLHFWCAYQPIVELSSQQPIGYESLLRGSKSPLTLIQEAIDSNSLLKLEYISHLLALNSFKTEQDQLLLFLNFYPTTLVDQRYLEKFTQIVERKMSPSMIVVEITEHVEVDRKELQKSLAYLSSIGYRIAIDDFNLKKQSSDYIYDINPDIVKLDKDCIQNWDNSHSPRLKDIHQWCYEHHSLLIAEGIETKEHHDLVVSNGIEYGQGWFLGKPEKPYLYCK